jgi:hypothetical protein
MKYILLLCYSIIISVFSLQKIKHKLCINCKYFIPDEDDILFSSKKEENNLEQKPNYSSNDIGKFGKCYLFPKIYENRISFLVNGNLKSDYYYCSTMRSINNACGEAGTMYTHRYLKKLN